MKLGRSVCNECGCRSRVLIVVRGNIFSKCEVCGFGEWEWSVGDDMDYLEYLAERYGVSLEELISAISL